MSLVTREQVWWKSVETRSELDLYRDVAGFLPENLVVFQLAVVNIRSDFLVLLIVSPPGLFFVMFGAEVERKKQRALEAVSN